MHGCYSGMYGPEYPVFFSVEWFPRLPMLTASNFFMVHQQHIGNRQLRRLQSAHRFRPKTCATKTCTFSPDKCILAADLSHELCPIEQEPIRIESAAMTPCGHVFNDRAITTWLQTSDSCPCCREPCEKVFRATDTELIVFRQRRRNPVIRLCIENPTFLHRFPECFADFPVPSTLRHFEQMYRLDSAMFPLRPSLKGPFMHIYSWDERAYDVMQQQDSHDAWMIVWL